MTEQNKKDFLDLRDFILEAVAERCEKAGMTIASPGVEWREGDEQEIVITVQFDSGG